MSTIRVGFIGCGGNASGHVGRILAMGECEVVGLCDVSETSIARVRKRHREHCHRPSLGSPPTTPKQGNRLEPAIGPQTHWRTRHGETRQDDEWR